MRKDSLYRRSKDVEINDASEENGDPLSGSADPFDALVNSKSDETTSSRSNGKKVPSPIPDDSDTEKDAETKNDGDKSETNGDSADNGNDDEEGYEVEAIVDHKRKGEIKYFKIRWKNYDASSDTWEPEEDLCCPDLIEKYLEEHPEAFKGSKAKKEKKVSRFHLYFVRASRWNEFTKNGVSLKVRISLPPSVSSRSTPKRTAAERKAVIDEPLSDNESTEKKKSPKGKRGRPKKDSVTPKSGKPAKKEEYEVLKIVDDEMRSGKKFYRIRWKGWGAKDDTWEPKTSLSCPEIIKAYEQSNNDNEEYEVEKIVGEKIEFGVRYFLVKWKGWSEGDNTWETEKSVDCIELIEKFRDSCRSSSKTTKRASSTKTPTKAKKARKAVSDDDDDEDDEKDDDDSDGDNEKEWEVERIVNQRKAKGKKEYLIRWKGCKSSDDTWEPEDGINCPELINAFLKKNKK